MILSGCQKAINGGSMIEAYKIPIGISDHAEVVDELEETRMMLEDAKELIFRLQAENEVMLTKLARPLKITMCDL